MPKIGPTSALPRTPRPVQKLKAERVELLLKRMSPWSASADRSALTRRYDLVTPQAAARTARLFVELFQTRRSFPWITVAGSRVVVRVSTPAVGGLTQADIRFARRLDQLVLELQEGK